MTRVFISYRPEESGAIAGRIRDQLVERFGERAVLMGAGGGVPGEGVAERIARVVRECQVALVLIGPGWPASGTGDGRRSLDDPADPVRLEIETALTQGVAVIPLLLDGATMPRPDQLPASLAPLTLLNAVVIRQDPDFRRDLLRVVAGIERARRRDRAGGTTSAGGGTRATHAADPTRARPGRRAALIGAILLVLVGSLAVLTETQFQRAQEAQRRDSAATRAVVASQTSLARVEGTASAVGATAAVASQTAAARAPYTSQSPSCDGGDWTVPPNGTAQTTLCKGSATWVHGDGSTDCYLEYDRASGYPARYAAQVDISGIAGLAGLDLPDGHRLLIANDGGYRFGSISGSVATSSTYTLRVVFQGSGGTAAVNGQQVAAFQPSAGAQRQMRLLVAPSSSGATFIGAYFAAFSFTPTA